MRLSKHHGLGNDFLVLLDLAGAHPIAPATARALCDRRTGIGGDGLIRVTSGGPDADVAMELLNADGSTAEMSGNGIRCLAQAVFQSQVVPGPALRVATAAGLRTVTTLSGGSAHTQRFTVEMGQAKVGADEPEWVDGPVLRATQVDVGNPHMVLHWAEANLPDRERLVELGERIDGLTPGGTNVEVVHAGPRDGELSMVVYERGVGPTQACGTGACAAAAAAEQWELTASSTTVHMPGGPVDVVLGDPVLLTGETTSIAVVYAPWP
ncbi:MAG: diaminopimelate epimerase [Acidimicrobiales bacterium]|nr:diaminopimelate epimerase [Acidimicrobiales bacterium]